MDREQQEQKGCLHTNMDPYMDGHAMPGGADLLLESFQFAVACREIDMRASPYDCSGYGFAAIPIETAAGRLNMKRLSGHWLKSTTHSIQTHRSLSSTMSVSRQNRGAKIAIIGGGRLCGDHHA